MIPPESSSVATPKSSSVITVVYHPKTDLKKTVQKRCQLAPGNKISISYLKDAFKLSVVETCDCNGMDVVGIPFDISTGLSCNPIQLAEDQMLHITGDPKGPVQKLFERSPSNEKFIEENMLDLTKPLDFQKYLIYLLEKQVNVEELRGKQHVFEDNCLEYRLERRMTSYIPNDIDNVKLSLAVSGAGKTRMLLELLHLNPGYYFTCKSSQRDFGSSDLHRCHFYCDNNPSKVNHAIALLYFVRVAVCEYLKEKGFTSQQILIAQIHPISFFGKDLFENLLTILLKEDIESVDLAAALKLLKPSKLCAVDEIQVGVESSRSHTLPGSSSLRPFFSPFMLFSKILGVFPQFIVSGTGINFLYVKEAMESGVMKRQLTTQYEVVSDFKALSKEAVETYAREFLSEHQVLEVEDIVSKLSAMELCHGRPRFVAYILDEFMKSRDIDFAMAKFVDGISNVDSQVFPLRFFKHDLDLNFNSFERVIDGDTMLRLVRDALIKAIWTGKFKIQVNEFTGVEVVRYGIGFALVDSGVLKFVELQEVAVIECLRCLLPFSYIATSFAERIQSCPKPQMVGYLMEYLVAFALVANNSGKEAASRVTVYQGSASSYLEANDPCLVCFPDHMCGPDIIYKCEKNATVYIVQVKFLKGISKQEAASAIDTTDPELFYHKRKGNGVIKGFDEKRTKLLGHLRTLQRNGYSLQQVLVIHSGGSTNIYTRWALLVTKENNPKYFDSIGQGVWQLLDSVRTNFTTKLT